MRQGGGFGAAARAEHPPAIVTVGQPFSAVNPAGFASLRGSVTDAGTTGLTLLTSTGIRVPVTTSSGTLVVMPPASTSQLQHGATIVALGHAGPGGTLAARAVAAISQVRPEHTSAYR